MRVTKEMDDVFGTGQQGQVRLDDDAIETVVYKTRKGAQGFSKVSIGRLLRRFWLDIITCPGSRWNQPGRRQWIAFSCIRTAVSFLRLGDLARNKEGCY
jgi:hypothetical protein